MIKLSIGYPAREEERQILHRRQERKQDDFDLNAVSDSAGLLAMRAAVEQVYVDPDLELYIVDLVQKTREHHSIAVGASPRGALALLKLARAWAAMQDRNYVVPDDIKHFYHAVLSHRIILTPNLWNSLVANQNVLNEILNSVPVPVIQGI
jgi:MoxR-like ATPase